LKALAEYTASAFYFTDKQQHILPDLFCNSIYTIFWKYFSCAWGNAL